MDSSILKREELVQLMIDAVLKDETILNDVIIEVKKNRSLTDREMKLIQLIHEDFEEYDQVFKALA